MRTKFRLYRVCRIHDGKRLGDLDILARNRADAIQIANSHTHVECISSAKRLLWQEIMVKLGLMEFRSFASARKGLS